MRLLACILLLLLVAVPATAARSSWDGVGRGTIQWPIGDCPATFELHLERIPGSSGWQVQMTLIQDAAVMKLHYLCLPGIGQFDFPLASGSDRTGWRAVFSDACSYRELDVRLPLPQETAFVPARVAEVEYDAYGSCIPHDVTRAHGAVALATREPI